MSRAPGSCHLVAESGRRIETVVLAGTHDAMTISLHFIVWQVTTDPRHDLRAVIERGIRFFEVQENPDLEAWDENGCHNGEGLRLSVGQDGNFSPGSGKTFVMVPIKDAKNSARAYGG